MGWLLASVLLVLGLVLLAVLLLRLIGPLRRIQAARGSLLATFGAGVDRLRGGVAELTSWWHTRLGAGHSGVDA